MRESYVCFFRIDNIYYYKYNGYIYLVDTSSINLLQQVIDLPVTIRFVGYSRTKMGKIIAHLLNGRSDIRVIQAQNRGVFKFVFWENNKILRRKYN